MVKKIGFIVLGTVIFATTTLSAGTGFMQTDKMLSQDVQEDGQMEPQKLKKLMDSNQPFVILDVRDADERAEGTIDSVKTVAMSREKLEFEVGNAIQDKNVLIVAFCRSGPLGILAAHTLRELGYKNATSLKGGLKGWAKLGYPIQTALGTTTLIKSN